MRPRALTIAGVDSSGGAGITADCATFLSLGVSPAVAVTAVTAQDASAVHAVHPVPPEIVAAQIEAAVAGGIEAAKTGMLVSAAHVEAVAASLRRASLAMLVVDPVIASTSGSRLLDEPGVDSMIRLLLPMARVVTPNAPEAARLAARPVRTIDDAADAARIIAKLGPQAVVVTGGHLEGEATDVLYDGSDVVLLPGARIEGASLHGSGCRFSAAVAAGLACGLGIEDAARQAKSHVQRGFTEVW